MLKHFFEFDKQDRRHESQTSHVHQSEINNQDLNPKDQDRVLSSILTHNGDRQETGTVHLACFLECSEDMQTTKRVTAFIQILPPHDASSLRSLL